MKKTTFFLRLLITAAVITGALLVAEFLVPYAALVVFLLVLSVAVTWMIINLLNDHEIFANIFEPDDEGR